MTERDAESVLQQASDWLEAGRRVVMATVVRTWRSSPRPVGSQMAVTDDGAFAGSVSGGCVESAVIGEAMAILGGRAGRTLEFGVTREQALGVGLPCGGSIEVYVGEVRAELIAPLAAARRARRALTWVTDLVDGEHVLWGEGTGQPQPLANAVAIAQREDKSGLVEWEDRRAFVHIVAAQPRLVVVGAVHLTQTLTQLSALAGFENVVIDPRTAFATAARFPNVRLMHDWPDTAVSSLSPDARTAVVVLSHDEKLDEPALDAALRSSCFYIGALGSRRTQQARRRRLSERGFSEQDLSRIHGPVGLDIGALTTPEIAIAIMAEIVKTQRMTTSGPAA